MVNYIGQFVVPQPLVWPSDTLASYIAVSSLEQVSQTLFDLRGGGEAQSTSAGKGCGPRSQSCMRQAIARGETSNGAAPISSSTSAVSQ